MRSSPGSASSSGRRVAPVSPPARQHRTGQAPSSATILAAQTPCPAAWMCTSSASPQASITMLSRGSGPKIVTRGRCTGSMSTRVWSRPGGTTSASSPDVRTYLPPISARPQRAGPAAARRPRRSVEHQHAADPVLALHQLEPLIDLLEAEAVRDEGVDVELAVEVERDELRDLIAALDAAERGAAHAAAGDQVPGDDIERLALAGDSGDRAQAPAHARRLDRLAHDRDQPGRLECVVGAEAGGLLEHPRHRLPAADPDVSGALAAGQLEALGRHVDADDPLG